MPVRTGTTVNFPIVTHDASRLFIFAGEKLRNRASPRVAARHRVRQGGIVTAGRNIHD
jgi:hypothetical protein